MGASLYAGIWEPDAQDAPRAPEPSSSLTFVPHARRPGRPPPRPSAASVAAAAAPREQAHPGTRAAPPMRIPDEELAHDSDTIVTGMYDPAKPNDYLDIKARIKAHRRSRPYEYSIYEPEEEPDTRTYNRFAPPASYVHKIFSEEDALPPLGPPPPGPPPPGPPPVRPHILAPGPPPVKPQLRGQAGPAPAAPAPAPAHGPAPAPAEKRRRVAAALSSQFTPQDPNFAARLMAKYGYREGEGLGAERRGITTPLQMSRVGRQGAIINVHGDDLDDAAQRYGEPSEVVVLENVGEAGTELPQEIGAEAEKHGIVLRVAMHTDDFGARVFVRFSGAAGAYRAVRAFDGMFLRGRYVLSQYYPVEEFERGNYVAKR